MTTAANPTPANPTPAPNPDAAVLDGGPGGTNPNPNPDPAAKPATAKLKIGDREFDVPIDIATAMNGFMEQTRTQLDELKAAKPTAQPAALPAPTKTVDDYDYATNIFIEPDVALARIREDILKQVRTEYQVETSRVQFWNDFYAANADLKDMDILVQAVLNKNYASLKDLESGKAIKELANLTKAAAAKMLKQPGTDGNSPEDRAIVEGASTPALKKAIQQDESHIVSLSDVVKNRQKAKRDAAAGRTSKTS